MNKKGFTILELLIAISVFTMILLLTTVGIIQITKAYYKGIAQANTQQTARDIINNVSQNIQFSSFTGITTGTLNKSADYGPGFIIRSFCIGDQQQYSYITIYKQAENRGTGTTEPFSPLGYSSRHVLWKSRVNPGCTPANIGLRTDDPALGEGVELIGDKMRLTKFTITKDTTDPSGSLFEVAVTIIYGDEDLIAKPGLGSPATWYCKTGSAFSSAFCAKTELKTVVGKRLSLGIQ